MSPGRLAVVAGVVAAAGVLLFVAFRRGLRAPDGRPRPPQSVVAPAASSGQAAVAVEAKAVPAAAARGAPYKAGAAVRGRTVRREGKGYAPVAGVAVRLLDGRDRRLPAL